MNRDSLVETVTGVLVAVLFAVSVIAAYFAVRDGEGFVTPLLGVYLTGLLLVAVLRDAIDARRWQLAFFAGVAVWGGYEYATVGDLFSLLFAVVGVAMVAANVFDLR